MAKVIKPEDLGKAILEELTVYSNSTNEKIYKAGQKVIKKMVQTTKDTAPYNARAYHAHYVDSITSKSEKNRLGGSKHTWYVEAPDHRLTHLLAKGHATRDGGRARSSPFLHNANETAQKEFMEAVKEAVKG